MNNLKVVIPLKTNSERIPNKNLRPFVNNMSLFDIKAQQLLKTFNANDIYVSSENPDVEKLVKQYGFNFHLRDIALTKSTVKENQLVENIVKSIPGEPDIMWCQVTQPLFNDFDKLINIYENLQPEYDSICVVNKQRHHLIDKKGNPINFNFGYWHKISQNLPEIYQVSWAAFIMRREMLEEAWYQIGRSPYLFQTNKPLVDIDEVSDFEIAALLYKYYFKS